MGQQGERAANLGRGAVDWAGRQGEALVRPIDELLGGRQLEMAGVPRGATPRSDVPMPRSTRGAATPRSGVPSSAPRSTGGAIEPAHPTRIAPEAPVPRNADATALGNVDSVAGIKQGVDEVLEDTAPKQRLSELSSQELRTELDLADDLPRKSINEPPYVEKIGLPDGHEWKRQQDGAWCRFSNTPPNLNNCLPPGAQELVDTVAADANTIISSRTKQERRRMAATSSSRSLEAETITGHFENISPSGKVTNFSGFTSVQRQEDALITITSQDDFIAEIRSLYRNANPLNLHMERKIRTTFFTRNAILKRAWSA